MKKIFYLAAFLSVGFTGCSEDDEFSIPEYYKCDEPDLTIDEFNENILGIWQLTYEYCPLGIAPPDHAYILRFTEEELEVYLDDVLVSTHVWTPEIYNEIVVSMDVEPYLSFTYGGIYLCNDKLAFRNIHYDGCDYIYFRDNSHFLE